MKYKIAWLLLYDEKQYVGFYQEEIDLSGICNNYELLSTISEYIIDNIYEALDNNKLKPTKFEHNNLLCLMFRKANTMGFDFWEFVIPIDIDLNRFCTNAALACPVKDMIEYYICVKSLSSNYFDA